MALYTKSFIYHFPSDLKEFFDCSQPKAYPGHHGNQTKKYTLWATLWFVKDTVSAGIDGSGYFFS